MSTAQLSLLDRGPDTAALAAEIVRLESEHAEAQRALRSARDARLACIESGAPETVAHVDAYVRAAKRRDGVVYALMRARMRLRAATEPGSVVPELYEAGDRAGCRVTGASSGLVRVEVAGERIEVRVAADVVRCAAAGVEMPCTLGTQVATFEAVLRQIAGGAR
jgi:hypothetical protein